MGNDLSDGDFESAVVDLAAGVLHIHRAEVSSGSGWDPGTIVTAATILQGATVQVQLICRGAITDTAATKCACCPSKCAAIADRDGALGIAVPPDVKRSRRDVGSPTDVQLAIRPFVKVDCPGREG